MNITIERSVYRPIWIAVVSDADGPGGEGDTPTQALQDLLLQMLEAGDRSPGLLAMINAENDAALLRNEAHD
jgi:hypothetical protein